MCGSGFNTQTYNCLYNVVLFTNGSRDYKVPKKPMFDHCFNILLRDYDNSDMSETPQTCSRIDIDVCTQIGICIVLHNQYVHGCRWTRSFCPPPPPLKTAIFFDLGRNMVLAYAIPRMLADDNVGHSINSIYCIKKDWRFSLTEYFR